MKQRKLGTSGLEVSAIGYACGGQRAGRRSTTPSPQQLLYLVRAAYDFGVSLFAVEAADEECLGAAIAPFRQKVAVACSFAASSHPTQIRSLAEASLKRLNVEAIDLFSAQHLAPHAPMEDIAGAVQDLITQGKVKHFGLCGVDASSLRRAHRVQPVSVLQSAYSVWSRACESDGTLQTCAELGIGFMARGPLGQGVLANPAANDAAMARLSAAAQRQHATVAQYALAWLLAQHPWIVPMPSTHRVGHLDEDLGGADLRLCAADLQSVSAGLAHSA